MLKISVITSLYKCERFLLDYLNSIIKQTNFSQTEFLLLHNAPSDLEKETIVNFIKPYNNIKHIIIPEREGLYRTWNRGIKLAQGQYIAVWNVDDIRTPDSLYLQQKVLDENRDSHIAYGDFWLSFEFGEHKDKLIVAPDWKTQKRMFNKGHQIGCFPMWRKDIHDLIGYFDEQLKIVGDYDFQLRAFAYGVKFVKAKGNLGYYLENQPHKLSMNVSNQVLENNLVYLRYGMFDKFNMYLYKRILDLYAVDKIFYDNQYTNITDFLDNYTLILSLNKYKWTIAPFNTVIIYSKILLKQILKRM